MTLQEIENSIAKLPPEQLAEFRAWFLEFDGEKWDKQIESDASAGLLDELANEAIREHREGKSTSL